MRPVGGGSCELVHPKLEYKAATESYLLYRFPTSCILCSEETEDLVHADYAAKVRMIVELQESPAVKFVGALRIPDTGDENNKNVDLVIRIKRKLYLVEVKYWSGKIKLEANGCWCQKHEDGSVVRLGNVVEEVKKRAALLELYLLRRGLELSSNFVQSIVVLAHPDCRVDGSILGIQQVFTSEEWKAFLRRKAQKIPFDWIVPSKHPLLTNSFFQRLAGVLDTTPTWDRITFEGGDIALGNFLGFNGCSDDMEVLKSVKRSRVSDVSIKSQPEHMTVLGFPLTTTVSAQASCTLRNYRAIVSKRGGKKNAEEPKQLAKVRGNTDVLFQTVGSNTPQLFTLSSVVLIQLSA
ncbi:hypothetical protein GOP47_0015772 [Adiantum capillus-veneris]|uniref:NERD domain-containing protein n=1 Tax=Adiantum capillus-veneris TaxID=13818 RepID=A0A9D4UKC2_ADICA|nr:hypothetical protein GOP47_0015772 [Adiantum capillus-veneris]